MIRLLAVVQTRPNQLLPSVQTDWCCTDSGPLEPKIIMTLLPARLLLPMPSPENVPFWEGSTPEEGTPRVSGKPSKRKGLAHTSPKGRGLRLSARGAVPRRARGGSCPGAMNLADIRDLVSGSSVVNSSFRRLLSVSS